MAQSEEAERPPKTVLLAQAAEQIGTASAPLANYGVREAAQYRSRGEGSNVGLWSTSDGASAGISSGPSAGGAGSAVVVSALAYLALSRCSSDWCSAVVVEVVEQAGSNARLRRQAAICIFISER